ILRYFFFFSSRRRHTRSKRDWSSDVCSSDLAVYDIKETTGKEHVRYTVCDMKDKKDLTYMIHKMKAWTNRIDVLVNNAGGPPGGSFMDMEDDDWYHAFELN